jgi:uncharacterized membrane protein YfcA
MVGVAGGLSNLALWQNFAALLPFALVGVWLGHQFANRMSGAVLRPYIYGFLCLSGFALCARALRGLYSM